VDKTAENKIETIKRTT